MKAYLHRKFAGLEDRIIVHPCGLPPGWTESNLSQEGQDRALKASELIYKQLTTRFASGSREVLHLNPDTLELIESFPIV